MEKAFYGELLCNHLPFDAARYVKDCFHVQHVFTVDTDESLPLELRNGDFLIFHHQRIIIYDGFTAHIKHQVETPTCFQPPMKVYALVELQNGDIVVELKSPILGYQFVFLNPSLQVIRQSQRMRSLFMETFHTIGNNLLVFSMESGLEILDTCTLECRSLHVCKSMFPVCSFGDYKLLFSSQRQCVILH